MRILLVSRVFWPNLGGIEKHVAWLGEALVQRGHHVDVVTLNRSFEDGSTYPPFDRHRGMNVYRVPFLGSTRYPLAPRVARFVRGYDVVHVHAIDFLADWLVATRPWHRRPVVLSTHGGFFHTRFAATAKKLWFHTMTRALFAQVDALVYTSDQDEALFRGLTARGVLVRTGVALEPWASLPRSPTPGEWITVGRVDVHKGVAHLLRTLAELKARDPRPFTMRVIGPEVVSGLVTDLTTLRDQLGLPEVSFAGRLPDAELHEAVRAAELGLWPAEYESFGISVVETMAAGVLPVLNDIPAFRHFHVPGLSELTPFAEPAVAAAAIARARDKAARDSAGGADASALDRGIRAKAAEFSWARAVEGVEAVYRGVLGRRG